MIEGDALHFVGHKLDHELKNRCRHFGDVPAPLHRLDECRENDRIQTVEQHAVRPRVMGGTGNSAKIAARTHHKRPILIISKIFDLAQSLQSIHELRNERVESGGIEC